ncbi:hypothetical protein SCG7086_AB_00010 [Chlamydiales bacterium SCGC AG-110-P3]|nr:hypothetical protein SCG7086_AB_00010 [Chlamydiales bacterium SCGC AG-110-P3]
MHSKVAEFPFWMSKTYAIITDEWSQGGGEHSKIGVVQKAVLLGNSLNR